MRVFDCSKLKVYLTDRGGVVPLLLSVPFLLFLIILHSKRDELGGIVFYKEFLLVFSAYLVSVITIVFFRYRKYADSIRSNIEKNGYVELRVQYRDNYVGKKNHKPLDIPRLKEHLLLVCTDVVGVEYTVYAPMEQGINIEDGDLLVFAKSFNDTRVDLVKFQQSWLPLLSDKIQNDLHNKLELSSNNMLHFATSAIRRTS